MQTHPTLLISDLTAKRIGLAMVLIGLISLAQAAGLFPLGSSTYPDALTLTLLGAAFAMIELGKNNKAIEYLQAALMLCAIALVIIF
ncbi:MAG: hypothetical protein O2971_19385 [Proteobacteria bacterium]|nr:hypothetical protein [Pseudomonadota bacterium]